MEVAGENDLFAPVNDDLPAATMAPEGDQEPVTTMPDIEEIMPMSYSEFLRENKKNEQPNESIAQSLTFHQFWVLRLLLSSSNLTKFSH